MKLEQSFTVAAPVDQVWAALIDVERIAPCLPGAEITGRDDSGGYEGTFSVKLGPTTAAYRGSLRMDAVDEAARTATMSAKGTDKRGQGGASATIVSTMRDDGGETHVDVLTDFHITGRLARFGRSGMIEDISRRLMRDFAQCLQSTLGAEPAATRGEGSAASGWLGAAADATGAPVSTEGETTVVRGGAAAPAPPVGAGDVPAEAAGGAQPSSDPAAAGTLGVPSPSQPGRQPPGTTGGAGGPAGVPESAGVGAAPDPADAAIASAGGAAAEAATAGSAPPGADDLAAGPAAPAPPPNAQTTPPPPPGGPGGEVPTAGGAGGTPPPPPTGPPPPPGGRPRHADTPEPALTEAPEPGAPGTGPLAGVRVPGEPPTPPSAEPEAASSGAAPGPFEVGAPPTPAPAPPEPEAPPERTGSVPPPGRPDRPPAPQPAKPIGGFSLFFSVLADRIKRRLARRKS
ncbi:MAG: uncharacterized protein QOH72_5675 [Solirubrobacteraceae bacterium]|jgi:carbon monoxide dehydrogenase subunit G|nr:uncharacterized protein [Solirubrobacteraceae bacterium]